ncbi:MAG: dehydrogenase [Verrucomicrobia bacterium SCN 57-15]|nr:MAG: dehydrogenase [Verrucomicrobia bacterium SCN 57-15]
MKFIRSVAVASLFVLPAIFSMQGAGRQLTGVYAPAATEPLSPEEAAKKMSLPEGFEARIFAVEPQVVNPVAMTWDDRGRLWVVELYEYPLGAAPGTKPRDQVKILEDTDNDGKADKVTVFADGLNLATGILLGYGGAFVGQAPDLLFLQDTDGDDKADKRTVLKTGFGLEDRHELLNGFTWGPDGYLYMTHGVFTRSTVKNPDDPNDDGVLMTAAVARYHPRSKKFEIFAEGTSNPWGVDFDRAGNAFVSACVIDHMFHMAPGGIYQRQAGSPPYPYAYELLPSIVDHKHFRAAYAGLQIYQGNQYPAEYKGAVLMGNIHDSAIHLDRMTPNGSSFKDSFVRDFVRANDGWFRPVSTQVGPDGAVWVMDWYDKYPCYQNAQADPEGVDRTHGRIWRIVYTGGDKSKAVPSHPEGLNLEKASTEELVRTLGHANVWQRRMAQRILSERQDAGSRAGLVALFRKGESLESRLAALWTLHTAGQLHSSDLELAAEDKEAPIRAWAARLIGERDEATLEMSAVLEKLGQDNDPAVRLAVATAVRQFVSGSLTVNTPPENMPEAKIGPILANIYFHAQSANDPVIPFMLWMAIEPMYAQNPGPLLDWFVDNGMRNPELGKKILRKAMLRLCDMGANEKIEMALEFIDRLPAEAAALAAGSLDGLIEGEKGKAFTSNENSSGILARLSRNSNREVALRARQLGTLWGDQAAIRSSIDLVLDSAKAPQDRVQTIQMLRQQKSPEVREAFTKVIRSDAPEAVKNAAILGISEVGGDAVPQLLLGNWNELSPALRRSVAEALSSRATWAQDLLGAIHDKKISVLEIPAPVVRTLVQSKDKGVRERAEAVIGKYRESNADKLKVIAEKKQAVLHGPIDLAKGHEVAQRTCFTCHKLYGEGADVGPDLTGVGRSSIDALLANVIDPNQIIGAGYENVEIETKDGRTVSGRMVENTDSRVKILSMGPKEEVIGKKDIESMRVSELSVMPEGLEQMPEEDFRNLIWYIFSPPQEKKPMSVEEERKALLKAQSSNVEEHADGESVALWNPEWRVFAAVHQNSPRKLPDFAGKHNVLVTHPSSASEPAMLERTLTIPSGKKTMLSAQVAADENGTWELRVRVNDRLIKTQTVDRANGTWKTVSLDLSQFAGEKVVMRLENGSRDHENEFAYWSELQVKSI